MYDMSRQISALLLSGIIACNLAIPAFAADIDSTSSNSADIVNTWVETIKDIELERLPNAVLYYGEIKDIILDSNNVVKNIVMSSENNGEFIFNIGNNTVCIDSGNAVAKDIRNLEKGDKVYVFHSFVSTMSIPPQSEAFAIVSNIPMDARSAMYHVVDTCKIIGNQLIISDTNYSDDSQLEIAVDLSKDGSIIKYTDDKSFKTPAELAEQIKSGTRIMAWYDSIDTSNNPGTTQAMRVMILPELVYDAPVEEKVLTRGEAINLIYENLGSPEVVNGAAVIGKYTDVKDDYKYIAAVAWAVENGIVSGYGNGELGINDNITKEQFITMLYRYVKNQGLGFNGTWSYLIDCSDRDAIHEFAYEAVCWFDMNKLVERSTDGAIGPNDIVTNVIAQQIIGKLINK